MPLAGGFMQLRGPQAKAGCCGRVCSDRDNERNVLCRREGRGPSRTLGAGQATEGEGNCRQPSRLFADTTYLFVLTHSQKEKIIN